MALFRILIATTLLAFLATPAATAAAKSPAKPTQTKAAQLQAPVNAAASVARRYWGATPCGGQIRYLARSPLGPGVDPTTGAWATFDTPLGANNLAAPAATYRNCAIYLARWQWPTVASMKADWDMLCMTMIHETGHLLGRAHDGRRGSVMVPVFTDGTSVVSSCRKARPRAATR